MFYLVLKKRRLCVSILLQPETFYFLGCRYTKCTKKTHTHRQKYYAVIGEGIFSLYNPKSEKVGTVWKTQIKKESSDL